MCGIFGWATSAPPRNPEKALDACLALEAHRGPDGQGTWFGATDDGRHLAFGHRRLAIIDLESGAQPLASHDDRYVVTFNGEVYNYIELREELRALGHSFLTASDTEVIVEAYRAWGVESFSRLRGMFAFALFDRVTGEVVVARDPFGKKPLFLTRLGDGFAFSSEIAPLLALEGVGRTLDPSVLMDYLVTRYAPGPATFFADVRKLPPGHYLHYAKGRIEERRYFHPPLHDTLPADLSYEEAVDAFGKALEEAVVLRMRSDAPFGAFLSGGLDSSVITALMARNLSGQVSTFSVGFEDAGFSELPYAAQVAKHLNTNHHEVIVRPDSFFDNWEDAVRFRGAPVSEVADIPILMLSRLASQSVKMVLTGEGSDEFLMGYPKYRAEASIAAYHRLIPPGLHKAAIDPFTQMLPARFRRIKVLSRGLSEGDATVRRHSWFASVAPADAARLLPAGQSSRIDTLAEDGPVRMSAARRLQLFDHLSWLPDNLLERGDRMMMGGSVEGRMPFMDVKLAELAATIPDRYMLRHPKGKAPLRTFAESLIDRRIIERPKVGFRVPVGQWFRSVRRDLLSDLLASEQSQVRKLLNAPMIDQLFREHMDGRQDHEKILWSLSNLELFLRVYKLDASTLAEPVSAERAAVAV